MDSLNYSFRVIWSDEDEAYVATCPEMPGISALDARAVVALAEARVALDLALETHEKEGWPTPVPRRITAHSGQFRLRITRTLHEQLVQLAEDEGVSLNALASVLLAEGVGRRARAPRQSKPVSLKERRA